MAATPVAEKPGAVAPAKKGKLGLVLTLAVGILLGAGLTIGFTRFVHADKPSEPPAEKAVANEQQPEPKVARRIIAMKPLIVNIKDTRMTRHLRVVIGLEVSNEKAVEELARLDIPVHDFLVDRLGMVKLDELDSVVDRNKLKRELMCGINELLEGGAVTKLYFADFVVQ
jgi:flagellar FliL protein